MTRLFRRLRAALYVIAFGGMVVALCHSVGVDAKTVGSWGLAGWIGMAGVVLVAGISVPVWEKAGQPPQPRQRRRARAVTGPQVTVHAKS
jgi:hypothetical protein